MTNLITHLKITKYKVSFYMNDIKFSYKKNKKIKKHKRFLNLFKEFIEIFLKDFSINSSKGFSLNGFSYNSGSITSDGGMPMS